MHLLGLTFILFLLLKIISGLWVLKAIEQSFPVVLFKVDQTFDSLGEILKCDHSNKSY